MSLEPGDIVKVRGNRGTYKVMWVKEDCDPPEVTVIGGVSGRSAWRTFFQDRVRKAKR